MWTNLTFKNTFENANTCAQVMEHFGVSTWKEGWKKELKRSDLGSPDPSEQASGPWDASPVAIPK